MEKLEHFAGLLVDLEIAKQVLPVLLDNGFDEWEQMVEIINHPQVLDQIGITDEKTKKQIMAAISVADDYEPSQQQKEQEQDQKEQEGDGDGDGEEEERKELEKVQSQKTLLEEQIKSQQDLLLLKEKELQKMEDDKLYKKVSQIPQKSITVKDLRQATSSKQEKINNQYMIPNPQRQENEFLGKLNVLSLNDKKFTDLGELGKCKNVKTLHLFQNQIYQMGQQFLNLQQLTTLHLENNLIQKIQYLDNCVNLQKLFLNNNYIWKLEGLQNCVYLKELQISNQLQNTRKFEFDEGSLRALGNNLSVLELENCNLYEIPEAFMHLEVLRLLKLRNNQLNTCEFFLEPMKNMNYLNELHVKGNPLAKQQKYRDKFVLMSKSLEQLDGKRILPREREFLFSLWKKKNGLMQQQKGEDKKNKLPKLDQVQGQQINYIMAEDDEYRNPKSYQKLNVGNDLRGRVSIKSSKHIPNPKYY